MKSSDCDLSLFYALIEWRHRKTHYKKTQSFIDYLIDNIILYDV